MHRRFLHWVRKYLFSLRSVLLKKKNNVVFCFDLCNEEFDHRSLQFLMKISGIAIIFCGWFSHDLKNKRMFWHKNVEGETVSQEERSLQTNCPRGQMNSLLPFPLHPHEINQAPVTRSAHQGLAVFPIYPEKEDRLYLKSCQDEINQMRVMSIHHLLGSH